MTEIKFRAWDKESKRFIDWDNFIGNEHGNWLMTAFQNEIYHFQQYTGIKDSEGREIYDGDICKRNVWAFGEIRTFTGQVKMFEGCWWIDSGTAAVPLWNEMHVLEVIGNIYKRPRH
ncbi:YopX family protein [Bacillus mobilis]|uniref:YopX family protein n=1 Tax=Bacillus mobilis TaxID=2026190 RepID=UPI0021CEBB1D|nr:YopX family protein [Bacillus mobilis]MCU5196475.1 YopX family protein [Bacillus mobilis]